MSMREEKKLATARRIRVVARELFLQKGYSQTSVEEIALAAGVSRAGLFNYYRGKAAILMDLSAELEPRLVQLVHHYQAKSLTTADKIRQLFEYAAKILEQTAALTRLLFVQGNSDGFPTLELAFRDLVMTGQQRGEVRQDLDAGALSETLYLGFIASLLGWCRAPDMVLTTELARRADALALMLSPPDHRGK
jgi:AcrR family transcriptional regulator